MTRGRFRPLSVWGAEPDSTLPDTERTPGTPTEHAREHRKDKSEQQVIEENTGNTEKTHCHAVRVHDHAGEAGTSGVCFRAEIYQDITHEQAGMVQCGKCGNAQEIHERLIRCRHPNIHGGLWPQLASDLWRRCQGFTKQAATKGRKQG